MIADQTTACWPEKLELNDWIELALNSSEEVSRQIALEELVATGVPPYLAGRVKDISALDTSAVCRQLAQWVISLELARIELRGQLKGLEVTPQVISGFLSEAEPAKASVITQMLRKPPGEEVIQSWRDCLAVEKNPRMIEAGLTILGRFGNAADCEIVPMILLEGDAEVVCAGLSLLQQRDLDAFKKQIRVGLTSKSFRVQLHAVHLLRQVDCDEAVRYIQAFLFHKNALIRQKALRELTLITFSRVENLFLQYLGREIQPLLLVKAGFVAAFNPSAEFPLKIYDIMMVSAGIKKHILQLIFKQSIEAVQAAGILKTGVEEYVASLKQRIALRRSEQIVRCAVADLANADALLRASAVERLSPFIENESIKRILKKSYASETSEEVRAQIEPLISEEPSVPPPALPPGPSREAVAAPRFPSPEAFLQLSMKEQRGLVVSLNSAESFLAARAVLLPLLKSDIKKNIVLEILKTVGRFGSRIDSTSIAGFLNDKDPSIVAQAVKTLGVIDIDAMLPGLNGFLANDDPRVKAAALEVFLRADKEGAVQYLQSMLRSGVIATRRLGLSLLPQLDYPSAEPMLWRLLTHEANIELQMQSGYMVAANPTREGMFRVFAFTHNKNGDLKPGFEEIWRAALISAENVFQRASAEIEQECWDAYKVEQEEKSPEKAAYAFNEAICEDDLESTPVAPEDTPVEKLFLHLFEFKWIYLASAVLLIPILWYLWGTEPKTTLSRSDNTQTASKAGFFGGDSKSSDAKTQVGSKDWKGTLKSGARELLNGKAYSSAINTGQSEVKQARDSHEKDFFQHMTDLANNPDASEDERNAAAANLNSHYHSASKAWEAGNFSEAEAYYEQAANDQNLNSYGKLTALQRLVEISEKKKDQHSWVKWQDRLLQEFRSMPGNESLVAFENFGKTFEDIMAVSDYLAEGNSPDEIVAKLRATGESEESARESVEVLKQMSQEFRKSFGSD
jgi:HEAT repeat protein